MRHRSSQAMLTIAQVGLIGEAARSDRSQIEPPPIIIEFDSC
jgi:hypothetical protein